MQHLLKTCIFLLKTSSSLGISLQTHTQEPAQNICFFFTFIVIMLYLFIIRKGTDIISQAGFIPLKTVKRLV